MCSQLNLHNARNKCCYFTQDLDLVIMQTCPESCEQRVILCTTTGSVKILVFINQQQICLTCPTSNSHPSPPHYHKAVFNSWFDLNITSKQSQFSLVSSVYWIKWHQASSLFCLSCLLFHSQIPPLSTLLGSEYPLTWSANALHVG